MLRLQASLVFAAGGEVDTRGGMSAIGLRAGDGRFQIIDNQRNLTDFGTHFGNIPEQWTTLGGGRINPFVKGGETETPNIVGLAGGADAYGIYNGVNVLWPNFASILSDAPPSALAAVWRVNADPLFNEYFEDTLLLVNLRLSPLMEPRLGMGVNHLIPLLSGGFQTHPLFGGATPTVLNSLPPGAVYATSIPGHIDTVSVQTSGASLSNALLSLGDVLYLQPGIAGDFNSDGAVDGADFLAWQRGQSPNSGSPAELVDWQINFGRTAAMATAATVPEPSSLSCAFLLTLLAGMLRGRQRLGDHTHVADVPLHQFGTQSELNWNAHNSQLLYSFCHFICSPRTYTVLFLAFHHFSLAAAQSAPQLVHTFLPRHGYIGHLSFSGGTGPLYFVDDSTLWRTNGTTEATVVRSFYLHEGRADPELEFLTEINGTLFFSVLGGSDGRQLWKSDGTELGTELVSGVSSPHGGFAAIDNTLYFGAYANGSFGLWKSDGTSTGTAMVANDVIINHMHVVGSSLLFSGTGVGINHGHGTELWTSDGTTSGTRMVKDIRPGSASSSPAIGPTLNGITYFRSSGIQGNELWSTDGTESGTQLVSYVISGSGLGYMYQMSEVNGQLFFAAETSEYGKELWTSDGTLSGTRLVKDIVTGSQSGVYQFHSQFILNGQFFFTAHDGLWRSDGTETGTFRVVDVNVHDWHYGVAEDRVFFKGSDSLAVPEDPIWVSDGTAEGTAVAYWHYNGFFAEEDDDPGNWPVNNFNQTGTHLYFWAPVFNAQ
ncbi:MAG TPA: hypothetical protein PJ982_16015, partial [Lacipirellulaceae bacterium]|nr:hypothetical protein [Lacipirellulaceae bacterium]